MLQFVSSVYKWSWFRLAPVWNINMSWGKNLYMYSCICYSSTLLKICTFWYLYVSIWAVTWDFRQCGMCDHQSPRSACAYAQTDQILCQLLEYSMTVQLLTEQHLVYLGLTGGSTGSSESTLVKMSHWWKSHVGAHMFYHGVKCLRKIIISKKIKVHMYSNRKWRFLKC